MAVRGKNKVELQETLSFKLQVEQSPSRTSRERQTGPDVRPFWELSQLAIAGIIAPILHYEQDEISIVRER
jgi:hypothetical protein